MHFLRECREIQQRRDNSKGIVLQNLGQLSERAKICKKDN